MRFWVILSFSIALFTMIFDAGNIVVPLVLGKAAGGYVFFALCGLCVTSLMLPFFGFLVTLSCEGDYRKLLSGLGSWPAFVISAFAMLLVGPIGAAPRCVTLAHSAFLTFFPHCSLLVFSAAVSLLLFFVLIKKGWIINMFGRALGPLMIGLLFFLMVCGFLRPLHFNGVYATSINAFGRGFMEGYVTLDLLYTIFFAGVLYVPMCSFLRESNESCSQGALLRLGGRIGLLGFGLLGAVAVGLAVLAAGNAAALGALSVDQLFHVVATRALGSWALLVGNAITFIACLTTAMALIEVFVGYISDDLLRGSVSRLQALMVTLVCLCGMSNLGFSGVARIIEPLAQAVYPTLIALVVGQAVNLFFSFNMVKTLVYGTAIATLFWYGVQLFL